MEWGIAGIIPRICISPGEFFEEVNDRESGQSASLFFFIVVLTAGKLPEKFVQPDAYSLKPGVTGIDVIEFGIILILLAPILLHIVTGIEYVSLWLVTEEDEGVDRTLRAVAYGSAPAVLSWIPYVGILAWYGVYLTYVGTRVGHGLERWKAVAVTIVPSVLVFGLAFSGFRNLRVILKLAGI
ncbi:MAG: YIP1 family protein [Halobacteria archaeon]